MKQSKTYWLPTVTLQPCGICPRSATALVREESLWLMQRGIPSLCWYQQQELHQVGRKLPALFLHLSVGCRNNNTHSALYKPPLGTHYTYELVLSVCIHTRVHKQGEACPDIFNSRSYSQGHFLLEKWYDHRSSYQWSWRNRCSKFKSSDMM